MSFAPLRARRCGSRSAFSAAILSRIAWSLAAVSWFLASADDDQRHGDHAEHDQDQRGGDAFESSQPFLPRLALALRRRSSCWTQAGVRADRSTSNSESPSSKSPLVFAAWA